MKVASNAELVEGALASMRRLPCLHKAAAFYDPEKGD
jgi:hypothetical protein